jgi:ATP-binding cassette subfamily F protein uup
MQIQEAERTGKLVVKAEVISFGYEDNMVIRDFSTTIMQGDRVGIIGPNGVGKTTLLGILLKHISPHKGDLRHGTRLQPTYLDQVRKQLDMEKSVQDNVADGREIITVNNRDRHVIGYLKDFLFSPDRARSPAKTLSGGERSRLLLARLFARPSNLLVFDEPTNDLDMPTLELLEELLLDFQGTVLLVSHDRAFLNNVVTSTLVFEGDQKVVEYIGGFDDWQNQKRPGRQEKKQAKPDLKKTKKASSKKVQRKLSYKEQQELSECPGKIESMEKEQGRLYEIMSDPMFYQSDGDEISRKKERLKHIEDEILKAYKRWEFLENTP